MVRKIRYTPVTDIVDYFKTICTLIGPIECTSMVTQIALNLGCPEMTHVSYIEGDVPILGLDNFMHAHILHGEPDDSISMLYEESSKAIRLLGPTSHSRACSHVGSVAG
jgi:hypothetical protein